MHMLLHSRLEGSTCQLLGVQLLETLNCTCLVVLLAPQKVCVVVDRQFLVFAAVCVGVGLCQVARCFELHKQRGGVLPGPHCCRAAAA